MPEKSAGEDLYGFQQVSANHLSFRVAVAGSGDRLLLCLHGFPESAVSWRHQITPMAHAGYRVWAPDLRGYAGTTRPVDLDAYRIETLLEDVTALIEAAKTSRVVLVGHDWGGNHRLAIRDAISGLSGIAGRLERPASRPLRA